MFSSSYFFYISIQKLIGRLGRRRGRVQASKSMGVVCNAQDENLGPTPISLSLSLSFFRLTH